MRLNILLAAIVSGVLSAGGILAQAPAAVPITHVLVTLTVNEGSARDQIMKVMPGEVRATVQLHLDGKIDQWFSRGDGKGVVFILNCKTVEEAKAWMEGLPLAKEKLATLEYMTLGPLTPVRFLMGN